MIFRGTAINSPIKSLRFVGIYSSMLRVQRRSLVLYDVYIGIILWWYDGPMIGILLLMKYLCMTVYVWRFATMWRVRRRVYNFEVKHSTRESLLANDLNVDTEKVRALFGAVLLAAFSEIGSIHAGTALNNMPLMANYSRIYYRVGWCKWSFTL